MINRMKKVFQEMKVKCLVCNSEVLIPLNSMLLLCFLFNGLSQHEQCPQTYMEELHSFLPQIQILDAYNVFYLPSSLIQ